MVPTVRPRVLDGQGNSSAERSCKGADVHILHNLRRRILCMAQRVKKTTGGRAWLPKWGLTGAWAGGRLCACPCLQLLGRATTPAAHAWPPQTTETAGMNQTQKATRRKNRGQEADLAAALRQAEAGDPQAAAAAAAAAPPAASA